MYGLVALHDNKTNNSLVQLKQVPSRYVLRGVAAHQRLVPDDQPHLVNDIMACGFDLKSTQLLHSRYIAML